MARVWIDDTAEIDAGIEQVHELLSDIRGWPAWLPGVRSIRVLGSGPIARRSAFSMVITLPPIPLLWLPNIVYALTPTLIEWGGGVPGTRIRHRFELTALPDGRTRVRHYEYATTLLALICRPIEPAILRHDLRWLVAVRERFASSSEQQPRDAARG